MAMIIDCHCHAGPGDGFTGPWDTSAPLGPYLLRARAAGIDRTVVFSAFHTDYARANRGIAAIVTRSRGRLIGFAFVHAGRDRGRVGGMIDEAVDRLSLRGIKAHRADARITREVCDAARRRRLPVLYDVMGDTPSVELFAGEYPDVNFIIPHLGSFADDWRAHRALLNPLARMPNVFTDTSGVRRFDYLRAASELAGPHKMLFGSDGPWLHPGVEVAKVRFLGLPPPDEALVLGGNAMRLLGMDRQPECADQASGASPMSGGRPLRRARS